MATREEKLKRMERSYKKASGMDSTVADKEDEGPGFFERLGNTVMDTLGEKKIESSKEDPRLKRHQESIRKEIRTSSMSPEDKEEEVGTEERGRRMRKLMLGLERPKKA